MSNSNVVSVDLRCTNVLYVTVTYLPGSDANLSTIESRT